MSWMLTASAAFALNGQQTIQLKQAGVSDDTLALMIREQTIETAALTIGEILDMKAAGIEEKTLQAIIKALSSSNGRQNVVYEIGPSGIRVDSVEDLLVLKEAGFSEETIRAIITVASADKDRQAYTDALRVLDNVGIWVTPPGRLPGKPTGPSFPPPGLRPQ